MLNSRDINLLRPDVAANCRILIALAKEQGFDVLVTGTVRDDEYQLKCYNEGHSNAKTPSFHGALAGLAFDICKNVKGQEYSDNKFWECVSKIGKQMGFTWGGDWKSIVDKPHFQWDKNGGYTGTMIRNWQYPPNMPEYKNEVTQYKAKIQEHVNFSDANNVWIYLDKHPFAKDLYKKWAESYK